MESLSQDLVVQIMSKLEGCTLASTASTCIHFRDAAEDERLWQNLCHQTWPSTSNRPQFQFDYKKLYADSFPLILHEATKQVIPNKIAAAAASSPSDFISFIDIYHKGRCIFSHVAESLIENTMYETCSDRNFSRFLCYPFKLDLLSNDVVVTKLPGFGNEIVGELRLSWIVLDKRKGEAVNISSWKPRSIYRSNSFDASYVICFGSVVVTQEMAECVITGRCKIENVEGGGCWVTLKELSLVIKDMDGSHVNGKLVMMILEKALVCCRSVNHERVEFGYKQFCIKKMEVKMMREKEDTLANIVCATIAIAALVGICYACAVLF